VQRALVVLEGERDLQALGGMPRLSISSVRSSPEEADRIRTPSNTPSSG